MRKVYVGERKRKCTASPDPGATLYSHAMRITVPTIPQYLLTASTSSAKLTREEAVDRVATFLSGGNATIVTGAGVSVDSGIRAYRGKDGRYMNPNYKCVFEIMLVSVAFFF